MLELNEVLLEGEEQTLSMMAWEGRLTCLCGGTAQRRSRWLYAMMGFEKLLHGFVCLDGEPLTRLTLHIFRQQMAYVPQALPAVGEVVVYEPPTVQEVFALKANRDLPISNGILAEEMKRTGLSGDEGRWLAVAVLRNKPILLVDSPKSAAADYLCGQAATGRTVIVASGEQAIIDKADNIIDLDR